MIHLWLLVLACMGWSEVLGGWSSSAWAAPSPAAPSTRARSPKVPPPVYRVAVQINTASAQELDALPGVGPAMAQRIVEARRTGGPFRGPADVVARVPGLGEQRLRRLVQAGLRLGTESPLQRAEPYTLEDEPDRTRPRSARPPR